MLSSNPFAAVTATFGAGLMQGFVLLAIALVVLGTLADIVHKGSAKFFFEIWRRSRQARGARPLAGGDLAGIAVQTAVVDVLASGEFCNPKRRIAHLLTMYGFIAHVLSTAVLVFAHPGAAAPALWPALWCIGAAMVCVGGYWFWFFIRVDVAAEGQSPWRLMMADLFILSLLATCTLALAWAAAQSADSAAAMITAWKKNESGRP